MAVDKRLPVYMPLLIVQVESVEPSMRSSHPKREEGNGPYSKGQSISMSPRTENNLETMYPWAARVFFLFFSPFTPPSSVSPMALPIHIWVKSVYSLDRELFFFHLHYLNTIHYLREKFSTSPYHLRVLIASVMAPVSPPTSISSSGTERNVLFGHADRICPPMWNVCPCSKLIYTLPTSLFPSHLH